jgi:hypothetical protein
LEPTLYTAEGATRLGGSSLFDLAADVTHDPAKPAAQQAQEGCSTSE